MPNLGDFLGQLGAAVTRARLQADLESIRVAELYAGHPYLKNFAIPRFRLPNVEITIPIVIDNVEELKGADSPKGRLTVDEIHKVTVEAVTAHLKRNNVVLGERIRAGLSKKLKTDIGSIERIDEVGVDVTKIAEQVTKIAIKDLGTLTALRDVDVKKWRPVLQKTLRIALINRRKPADLIRVSVETGKVKETGTPETLTRIKLSLSEEAMEWTMDEGEEPERLTPE